MLTLFVGYAIWLMSKEYKLDELHGGITDKNLHKHLVRERQVGKEIW